VWFEELIQGTWSRLNLSAIGRRRSGLKVFSVSMKITLPPQ
jgi:hypothetical protein